VQLDASNLEGAKTSPIATSATRRHYECLQWQANTKRRRNSRVNRIGATERDRKPTVTSVGTKRGRSIKIYDPQSIKICWGQSAGFHLVAHEGLVCLHSTVFAHRKRWHDYEEGTKSHPHAQWKGLDGHPLKLNKCGRAECHPQSETWKGC
jgi:hypothetical protein